MNETIEATGSGSRPSPRVLPFGGWPSPVTPALVAAGGVSLAFPGIHEGRIFWCEGRPAEAGRVTVLVREPDGTIGELTPAPFNLRSRVHEYGGRAYAVAGGLVVGVDFAEQRLWRLAVGRAPEPLTPAIGTCRYADLEIDVARGRLLAVQEEHADQGEPTNRIVAVDLATGAVTPLVMDRDFVAAPRLDRKAERLAWLAWDHPDMPWDGAELWTARIGRDGRLEDTRHVAGGPGEAVVQPAWHGDRLLFASDASGFWNLRAWDGETVQRLHEDAADCAGPLWLLGSTWFAPLADGRIALARAEDGFSHLGLLEPATGRWAAAPLQTTEVADLVAEGSTVMCRAGFADRPPAIVAFDAATGTLETVTTASSSRLDPAWIAAPEPVSFSTPAGSGHAFLYRPRNPLARPPAGERPPMIVRSHGGPTSQARASLSLPHQFWTSRGFAVLDVNYRGSTGFGRDYRRALEGLWGIADVEDCLAAAQAVVAAGEADPARLVIAGASAGGFTTLAALAFTDEFRAGASHYGVGDLEALAKQTHKLESRYLDRLVGPWPERAALYRARSPIHHLDGFTRPVIFFQGSEDRIVPPAQATTMAAALRSRGVPVAHIQLAEEGHGFRRADSIERVLAAEHAFYCRIFAIPTAEPLVDLQIDGLDAPA